MREIANVFWCQRLIQKINSSTLRKNRLRLFIVNILDLRAVCDEPTSIAFNSELPKVQTHSNTFKKKVKWEKWIRRIFHQPAGARSSANWKLLSLVLIPTISRTRPINNADVSSWLVEGRFAHPPDNHVSLKNRVFHYAIRALLRLHVMSPTFRVTHIKASTLPIESPTSLLLPGRRRLNPR